MFIFFLVCSQQIEALRIAPHGSNLFAEAQANPELQDCDLENSSCSLEVSYTAKLNDFNYHLNGEPKSATTWLEFVVDGLMAHVCKGTASSCKSYVKERKATLSDGSLSERFSPFGKHKIPVNISKQHGNSFDFSEAPQLTADQIKKLAAFKVQQSPHEGWLAIVRDPRDVLVSACYHLKWDNCSAFVKYKGKNLKEKYKNSIDWIKLRYELFSAMAKVSNGQNAHVVFFENLKKDFSSEARRISKFLQLQVSDKDIDAVELETSLSQMKKQEEHGKVPKGGEKAQKVRKGESCAFSADLNEEVENEITEYMKQTLPPELYAHWQC